MSRKQSAVERIRKKASATASISSRENSSSGGDPYHNGETPSCQILVDAVQDIFPELNPERAQRVPSSELGQMLRWQVLKRRKERAFPPAPPLSSPDAPKRIHDVDDRDGALLDVPALGGNKKKRKKKKKKRDANGESSGAEMGLTASEESETGEGLLSGTIIEHSKATADGSSFDFDDGDEDVLVVPLKEEEPTSKPKTKFDPSLDALDRSLHEMEAERCRYEDAATPNLCALPSDGTEFERGWDTKSHNSAMSFDDIPQESTDRDDEDPEIIAAPLSHETTLTPTRPGLPRLRPRTLSASSFESFDGGVPPSPDGPEDSDLNYEQNQTHMVSPTHEWVPEEQAEAKTETPPGDVIKNPLRLPYLLTLNTDNGMTTTTINGKLIYAEKANANIEDYQLGSLEATRLLMEDWLGQVVVLRMKRGKDLSSPGAENDSREFLKYLQPYLNEGSAPRGIPLNQFVGALEQIECPACRVGVTKLVQEWSDRAADKPLVLNPSVLNESHPPDDGAVDAAFDYVALEEGHHLPTPHPPADEDGLNVDRNSHLSFFVRDSDAKNNSEKCLYIDRIHPNHLSTLVETWLPCGIEEEDLVNTSINDQMSLDGSNAATVPEVLDPEEANRIQRRILNRIEMAQSKLHEIQKEGKELEQDLERLLSEGAATQNINIIAFTKIKAVDDKCTAFKGRLFVVVKNFSDGVECAGENLKLRLWTSYLEALNKILRACDRYYEKLAETTDQRGNLPNAFLSAPFRDLVQTLVKEKITAWVSFVNFICELFSGAALQEYITRMIWHTERAAASLERSGMSSVVCKMCNDLAIELSTWTETVAGAKMGSIYQVRMTQTEQILERLQTIIEPLSDEYASVQRYFSTERNLYFASLRSNILLAQGVKKRMRLIDNVEVEGMVTGVLLMWTHVRLMQNKMIYSASMPPLPLQLKRFMWLDARSMYDSLGMIGAARIHSREQRHCHLEVKSKRKALCILAGLAYRWLKEQFDLWRAQRAELELLQGFDVESPAKMDSETPKPSKSKKGKKKKSPKSLSAPDLENSIILEGATDLNPEGSSSHHGGDASADVGRSAADKSVTHQDSEMEIVLDDVADNVVMSTENKAGALEDDHNSESSDPLQDTEANEEMEPDPFIVQVFIDDGRDRIAPEDFLMGRLRQVMLELGTTEKIISIS